MKVFQSSRILVSILVNPKGLISKSSLMQPNDVSWLHQPSLVERDLIFRLALIVSCMRDSGILRMRTKLLLAGSGVLVRLLTRLTSHSQKQKGLSTNISI